MLYSPADIAMAENRTFPAPTWAKNITHAHQGPWAGIYPVIDRDNPKTMVSRAEQFVSDGHRIGHGQLTEIKRLPDSAAHDDAV